jgi:Zn-dependent M28 family amino/carboxypeptidase
MKFRSSLILFIIFITFNAFPQSSKEYFTIISLNDIDKVNSLEELELPVYGYSNNSLITLVSSTQIDVITKLNVDYKILDVKEEYDKYFNLSSKKEIELEKILISERFVFSDNNMSIVKNLKADNIELIKKGIQSAEIVGLSTFKNQKYVNPEFDFQLTDSSITQITSAINPDSIRYFVQSLQNFGTRFLFAETRDSVAAWIKNQFLSMGYTDVVVDSFEYSGTWQKNVIATLTGLYEPDVINIIGGHHDSYSSDDPLNFAPGADDNASGTSAVLEIARVIKEKNYQPESTIKFITFGAEEYGLWGSKDYALKAYNSGMDINIMINHDMISHTYSTLQNSVVDINYYTGFEYLMDLAQYCTEYYSVITSEIGSANSSGSDSHSFWQQGFPSVYFEESDFSPFYHSPADTIGNYSMEFCAEVIKSSCATLLLNMFIPSPVKNYQVVDAGNGSSLILSWDSNLEPDLEGYKIYVGTSSGNYDLNYTTSDTVITINYLTEEVTYYIGVSAVDLDGFESIITERSATPRLIPLVPEGFSVTPGWLEINLLWNSNAEIDLAGYNIYRSNIEGDPGEKLNADIITDTTYFDNSAISGFYYYYSVTAVDSLLNESEKSITLRSRVVSLDQGILIVDETLDGDGSLLNPTDEQVDEFYNQLLSQYNCQNFDLFEETSISLADMGAFSTVIWHGNDFQDIGSVKLFKDEIREYLNFGGNFLYTGFRPAKAFELFFGHIGIFFPGDFIFDYLKIDSSEYKITALFIGALNDESGYNDIFIDSSKTKASDEYHLGHVESISPSTEGTNIYLYESLFDTTTNQGSYKGKPIGVEYIGNDFKTVTLSIPLYFMDQQQAQDLIDHIMIDKFGEITGIEDEVTLIPDEYVLYQNYPNPFNPNTIIKYSLPEDGFVNLTIFNMLGEEINTLVNQSQKSGNYEVEFTASNLPSGIYFYRFQTSSFRETKKMVILK